MCCVAEGILGTSHPLMVVQLCVVLKCTWQTGTKGGFGQGDPLADPGPLCACLTCSCIDCRERLEGDARDPLFMLPSKAPDPMSCTAMTCARASEPCGEGDKVLRA